jgi:septal ring factor EnvC (AmiA/AmiB activator)
MFGTFKMIMVGVMVAGLAGAGAYVFKLRADNATLKANQIKLESAVSEQKELIQKQQKDFKEILQANQDMNKLVEVLKKDIDELDKRFNKGKRDIGKLAVERSKVIEKIINKGGDNAARCLEIASGAPLTEKEKNAKKKSEINPECPSIANPNYVAY